MLELTIFLSCFLVIFVAEMGDRTQFALITLGAKYDRRAVITGAILAFAAVNGIAVILGSLFISAVPDLWVGVGAGILFLSFGIVSLYGWWRKGRTAGGKVQNFPGEPVDNPGNDTNTDDEIREEKGKSSLISSFSLMFVMEFGDKTQIATATLAATYGHPLTVFTSAMLALSILTLLGVYLGSFIGRRVKERTLEFASGAVFILFGIIFLVEALVTI